MTKYVIDTNIVIYTLQAKSEYEKIVKFVDEIYDDEKTDILYPVVVEAELFSRRLPDKIKENIDELFSDARIIKVDSVIARKAGEIRAKGKEIGVKIKLPDALIAATAIIEEASLVTHNISDFLKIAQFEALSIIDPVGES
ncbi:MAG: type II toxin-antitoxin system VapC family toxin [Thermincola sp.]|nr:type II toxin-antitoxin system VapC family toxin [Thermincola sp.]MDT3703530.1 type II toxin-antitoxin system VapC family toxin [Thermincola sp.]